MYVKPSDRWARNSGQLLLQADKAASSHQLLFSTRPSFFGNTAMHKIMTSCTRTLRCDAAATRHHACLQAGRQGTNRWHVSIAAIRPHYTLHAGVGCLCMLCLLECCCFSKSLQRRQLSPHGTSTLVPTSTRARCREGETVSMWRTQYAWQQLQEGRRRKKRGYRVCSSGYAATDTS
jgi:hypothetical protein